MERVKDLASGLDPHGYIDKPKGIPSKPEQTSMKRQAPESLNEATSLPTSNKIRKQDYKEDASIGQKTDINNHAQILNNSKYNINFLKQSGQAVQPFSHQTDVKDQKNTVCKDLPESLKLFISKLPSQSTIQHSNAVEIFYISASKARIHPDFDFTERKESVSDNQIKKGKKKMVMKSYWTCTLYIGDLLIFSAENMTKAEAKRDCFTKAIDMLFKPRLYIKTVSCVNENGRRHTSELCIGDFNRSVCTEPKNRQIEKAQGGNRSTMVETLNDTTKRFGNFILFESSTHENPITTIMCSASKNKVDPVFEISETSVKHNDETGYLGTLILGGKVIAHAVNQDKKAVKRAVAEAAVKELKTSCFTITTKFHEHESAQSNAVGMESIKTDEQNSTKITSGIGMQLLKKMGWSGEGGLGKKGQGIVEPVQVEERSNREGFGTAVATPTDINALKEMVKNFATGDREDDLVFSSDLSNEQRKVVHTTCRKFNLKSTSYGREEDRYLIISRKRELHQLVQYIAKNGGETLQYKLMPPNNNQNKPSD